MRLKAKIVAGGVTATLVGALAVILAPDASAIIGGSEAEDYWATRTAQVFSPDSADNGSAGFKCSGSIVGKRHVLTAAHCVGEPGSSLYVRVGSTTLREGDVAKVVEVSKKADLAVLFLEKEIGVPVAIAPQAPLAAGQEVLALGWGTNLRAGPPPGTRLSKAIRKIVPNDAEELQAAGTLEAGGNTILEELSSSSDGGPICVTVGSDNRTGQGDSGGPIFVRFTNSAGHEDWVLVAVHSRHFFISSGDTVLKSYGGHGRLTGANATWLAQNLT